MLGIRVIPSLLLRRSGLVKGSKFTGHRYIGDPMNAVKIFNEKEVDELVFLDVGATPSGAEPNFSLIQDIATEAFMPLAYGGGVSSVEHVGRLIRIGVEKVILNTAALVRPAFIREAADLAGSSSVVVGIDVRRSVFGRYEVVSSCGAKKTGRDPVEWAAEVAALGAGEILLTSVDREGTMKGYDVDLVRAVTSAVHVPVIASGGAGGLDDFLKAVEQGGAAAVSAGNMFVFHGKHRAVLITYPDYRELEALFRDHQFLTSN